jgi:hypothetical protein
LLIAVLPGSSRENRILYTNTKIGDSMLSTARSGFDVGRFNVMQVRDRRYPVVDPETGAVMSLVRFGDPMESQRSLTAVRPAGQAAAGAGCDGRCRVRQPDLCGVPRDDRGDQCVLDSVGRECEDAVGGGDRGGEGSVVISIEDSTGSNDRASDSAATKSGSAQCRHTSVLL